MRNVFKYLSLMIVLVAFWGCQEEEPELGSPISASELNFEIYQDANDPNKVILESHTPNVIPFWTTPSGRSTSVTDTVRLAFPGTYKFVYSVQSRGGIVSADTTVINITTSNLSYVDDPLYNLITGGGPGNSKTWLLDLDEEGVSKYFIGPMYFLGSEVGYGEECLVEDGDCWDYKPDWQGNQWVATLGDYGSMTFGLENNATLVANHNMIPARGQESGVFEINTDTYTLSTSDATPLHTPNYEECVDNWGQARIISLTENTMQLGFFRKASCESVALLVFNYISEEYAENWVPEDQGEPEPDLPDDWQDDVNQQVNTELTWILSPETPFNYANLDGTLMNPGWNSPSDYPEWTGYTADLAANFAEFSLTFNSADSTALYTDPSGNENEGSYVLSENGIYTFEGIDPNFNITPGTSFAPSAENQLRILQIEYSGDKVSGMWVGVRDPEKPEYLAYKLILQEGGSGSGGEEPGEVTEIPVDNSKVPYGDLENNGNFRIELYNGFGGPTLTDPPIDPTAINFNNKIEMTFTIEGVTLASGASGNYTAAIGYANPGFDPSSFGSTGGAGEVNVTGDGTYTVYVELQPGKTFEAAHVLVIDIIGMANDIEDLEAVTATVDQLTIQ